MPRIFVFTIINAQAKKLVDISVEVSIPKTFVISTIGDNLKPELEKIHAKAGGFYAWGSVDENANQDYWKLMEPGDYILGVHEGSYKYAAQILGKFCNDDFAQKTWGKTVDGK